jgi:hypothetical protein
MASKADYDPIPDVEAGAGGVKEEDQYRGLNDSHVELLSTLDDAIANSSQQFRFQLPALQPEQVASNGQAFVTGLVAPTVTAVSTAIAAVLLNATNKAEAGATSVVSLLILIFPYVNACAVFMSSFAPMRQRLMAAIAPIFGQMDHMQALAVERVGGIATAVEDTLDSIQKQVQEVVVDPIRPTLDIATRQQAALQRIRPGIDIPDPTDIDREFDEARGLVGLKIAEAETYIDVDKYLPKPLQSADAFYWRVVFPIALIALLTQLGLAFATTYHDGTGVAAVQQGFNGTDVTQKLGASALLRASNLTKYQDQVAGLASNVDAKMKNAVGTNVNETRDAWSAVSPDDKLNDLKNVSGLYQDEIKGRVQNPDVPRITDIYDRPHSDVGSPTVYRNKLGGGDHGPENDARDSFNALTEVNVTQGKDQLRESVQQYEEEYEAEFEAAVGSARSMLTSVAISYAIAFLQLALVYVITNKAIKAWLVNKALEKASDGVARTLREHGVSGAVDDVFGTRMGRVRLKILKILKLSKDLKLVLDKLEGITSGNPAMSIVSDALEHVPDNPVASLASGANALADRMKFGRKK